MAKMMFTHLFPMIVAHLLMLLDIMLRSADEIAYYVERLLKIVRPINHEKFNKDQMHVLTYREKNLDNQSNSQLIC